MKAVLVFIAALFVSSPAVSAQGAQACGVCHSKHLSQWSTSSHARSWSSASFQLQMERFGSEEACGSCHSPASIWQKVDTRPQKKTLMSTPDVEPLEFEPSLLARPVLRESLREEGVACGSCHLIEVFSPVGRGEEFLGPYHSAEGHGGRPTGLFQSATLCGSCHGKGMEAYPPEAVSSPDFHHSRSTAVEFELGSTDCSTCHMPRQEGHLVQLKAFKNLPVRQVGSHSFEGIRYEQLAEALNLSLESGSGTARLVLLNSGLGHTLQVSPDSRYRILLKKGAAEHSIEFKEASSLRKGNSVVLDIPPELAASPVELQLFLSRPEQEERLVLEAKL